METIWDALGRNNTDKVVSQEIQYQTAALFTTYSGGGTSVSFINWWAGSFELPAQAKLAVVFTIASKADFCGYLWCVRVRARCYVPAPLMFDDIGNSSISGVPESSARA